MNRTLRSGVLSHLGIATIFLLGGRVAHAEGPVTFPKLNTAGQPTRIVEAEGFRVELDLSRQVIDAKAEEVGFTRFSDEPVDEGDCVEIVVETPLLDGDAEVTRLKPGRRFLVTEIKPKSAAIRVLLDGKLRAGWVSTANVKRIDIEFERFIPSPVSEGGEGFVSTGILMAKAKQFDDGLYAAVELAAQEGAGDFAGKKVLLGKLLEALGRSSPSKGSAVVAAAAKLGEVPAVLPPALGAAADAEVKSFLTNPLNSKPLGFYTWSDELKQIFQQDRILQAPLKAAEGADAVAAAFKSDAEAARIYARYLALVSRLTNPWEYPDFRAAAGSEARLDPESEYRVFPPSTSHEARLIKQLFGTRPIPEGFDLMNELIARVRKGAIDLKPTKDSGWYDYQTYALETLVVPQQAAEAAKIRYDQEYQKLLTDYFKGALALARETHVKQLESPSAGAAAPGGVPRKRIYVAPDLSVEPTATHFRRRADAYRFVHGVLRETFGEAGLKTMHRLTAEGRMKVNLDDELTHMTALFDGAALVASRQLGLKDAGAPVGAPAPGPAASAEAAAEKFLAWSGGIQRDPDLAQDARMMVPVFYDVARRKTKVWVFLGWKTRHVSYRYATPPSARVFDAAGKPVNPSDPKSPELVFNGDWGQVSMPVVEEVYVSKLLDREEFRRHCDAYQTRTAILTNLE